MEYKKEFDEWNSVKKRLGEDPFPWFFKEKEIWWCSIGVNVGSEHDGKGRNFIRPVYIVKKVSQETFIGIPLTSKLKEDHAHVSFYFNYDLSTAILNQVRVFDKKRLLTYIGITSDYLHNKMKKTIAAWLAG